MMKTKKVSLIAGISVCSLVVLLTVVYAVLTDAFVSAEKYAPPCDIEESYAKDAIVTPLAKDAASDKGIELVTAIN